MAEDQERGAPDSFTERLHRQRPDLARWLRTLAAIACIAGGAGLVARGVVAGDALWSWLGAGLIVTGVTGILLAWWMHRRSL